ncbi:hypothetical protein [Gloeobacter morelensis]|uniref:DUF2283 domain-containing protein n=1 Tax=Gloeobacter morelensis MG652769 TaxID=2781736 RepID=A0ABY3PPA0_9CYAN|nr:hypothetical protein [Gloeobacter morelensis]UFP95466.1 hypothetical protein ISF26_04235 [Gloeobacter morelensis MG652769]
MSSMKVFYEPSTKLLTVFWKEPTQNQISSELGDGIIQIKDEETGEPIGIEFLSYHPGDPRLGIMVFTDAQLDDGSY